MQTWARGHKRLPLSVKRDERFSWYDQDAISTTDGNKISISFAVPSRTGIAHQRQQWRTQEFCSGGGVQQIQLRTEDTENGDLGAVAP